MTANNREEFFTLLESELTRIGIANCDEIKADFERHFEESAAQGISEEDTAVRLGDVKEIARNYLNIESSRLNSIIARDVENNKKVSLRKKEQRNEECAAAESTDVQNSDCVRECTPEHFSEEIYPSVNNIPKSGSSPFQSAPNASNQGCTDGTDNGTDAQSGDVADAFSNAGKAVGDAARVVGKAVSEAFENSNVKDAVKDAGQSIVDAAKSAAHKCREGVKKSVSDAASGGKSGGFGFERVKGTTPNVNLGKLIGAIIMDVLLWSWILPLIICGILTLFFGAISALMTGFETVFTGSNLYLISRILLSIGQLSLGVIVIMITMFIVTAFIKLIKYIIGTHIKAVYDL